MPTSKPWSVACSASRVELLPVLPITCGQCGCARRQRTAATPLLGSRPRQQAEPHALLGIAFRSASSSAGTWPATVTHLYPPAEAVDGVRDEHDVLVPVHQLPLAGGAAHDQAVHAGLDLVVHKVVVPGQVEATCDGRQSRISLLHKFRMRGSTGPPASGPGFESDAPTTLFLGMHATPIHVLPHVV